MELILLLAAVGIGWLRRRRRRCT
ncbi:PEP-CTERM sorting domain-containing protein [Nocardia yunnanensis]|uniref:PEP-CTERM sorting domain-containing protein n=1 Tax=Nocardia yunnanensis TaxID=2382165 RepID=A0A386ZSC1_9NOCA|nr:PEP-CTERM sorting domain-containing protein [Nocardia yunnanensis]